MAEQRPEHGVLTGWYVNLEQPHAFGENTVSTSDDVLDLWVPVDTLTPRWKDEDEFAVAIQAGRISTPDWTRPTLPENWATLD